MHKLMAVENVLKMEYREDYYCVVHEKRAPNSPLVVAMATQYTYTALCSVSTFVQ